MAERLATCAANASKHPGLANKANDIPRRSQAQVQAERAAKAREKAEKQAAQVEGIQKAAQLERKAREKLTRLTQAEKIEPAPVSRSTRSGKGKSSKSDTNTNAADQQPGLNAMDVDPLPSGSDYNPEKEGEGESEPEPEVELDNDEPDTMIQHNKGGKKEKRGLLARQKIKSLRDANGSSMESEDLVPKQAAEATKRKAEAGSGLAQNGSKAKKAKSSAKLPAGIVDDWEERGISHPIPTASSRRSASSASSRAALNVDTAHSEPVEDDIFHPGGIPSDNEEIEHIALPSHKIPSNARYKSTSAVKIETLHEPMLLTTARASARRRNRPTQASLPLKTQGSFPMMQKMAYDIVGTLDPFEIISDGAIVEIWNMVYKDIHPIDLEAPRGTVKGDLFFTVKYLIKSSNSTNWTSGFWQAAVKAVDDKYSLCDVKSLEQRAKFVNAILGAEDKIDRKRPFLWQSTDDLDWDFETELQNEGLFLGRLVAKTLALHLGLVSGIPEDIWLTLDQPKGALKMSILAVHRALLFSVTGRYQPVGTQKEIVFSTENWCDYIEDGKKAGTKRLVRRASMFKERIDMLTDEHWEAIMKKASEFVVKQKVAKKEVIEIMDVDSGSDGAGDDDLFDPKFDVAGSSQV